MALLFADGCSHYATDDILKKWTGMVTGTYGPFITAAAPRRPGTSSIKLGYNAWIDKSVNTASRTIIFGAAFYFQYPASNDGLQFRVYGDSTTPQCTVSINTLDSPGSIQLWGGNYSGPYIIATQADAIQINTWHYIEAKLYIHDTNGTASIRLDGEPLSEITGLTGLNLARYDLINGYSRLRAWYAASSTSYYCYIQDIVIMDGTGSSCNDFIGSVRIDTVYPESVGDYNSDWDYSTTSLEDDIDDLQPDGDTSYITATANGDRVSFNYQDIEPPANASIVGVVLNVATKKATAGYSKIVPFYRTAADENFDSSTPIYLADSYTIEQHFWPICPYSVLPWSEGLVENGQFGVIYDTTT